MERGAELIIAHGGYKQPIVGFATHFELDRAANLYANSVMEYRHASLQEGADLFEPAPPAVPFEVPAWSPDVEPEPDTEVSVLAVGDLFNKVNRWGSALLMDIVVADVVDRHRSLLPELSAEVVEHSYESIIGINGILRAQPHLPFLTDREFEKLKTKTHSGMKSYRQTVEKLNKPHMQQAILAYPSETKAWLDEVVEDELLPDYHKLYLAYRDNLLREHLGDEYLGQPYPWLEAVGGGFLAKIADAPVSSYVAALAVLTSGHVLKALWDKRAGTKELAKNPLYPLLQMRLAISRQQTIEPERRDEAKTHQNRKPLKKGRRFRI